MFTDRFLRLPVSIEKVNANTNLGEGRNETRTYQKLAPLQIESYMPTYNDTDGKLTWVNVRTKSGDCFTIHLTIDELEHRLNNFIL